MQHGGGRGIRTPGDITATVVFKTTALVHSAIPPRMVGFFRYCVFAALNSCTMAHNELFDRASLRV